MEETRMRRMLAGAGFTGTGTRSGPKSTDVAGNVSYGSRYKTDGAMNLPGPGAMVIRSPFPGPAAIAGLLDSVNDPDPTVDYECLGGSSVEEYAIDLPDGVQVQALPKNVDMSGKNDSYRARCELGGH